MSTHPRSYTVYRVEQVNVPLTKAEVPWRDPLKGEVVVKVLACGICGSDGNTRNGVLMTPLPRILGHEIVGDVVAVHPGVTQYRVGQRVGAPWVNGWCGTCDNCQRGKYMGCKNLLDHTTGGLHAGGFAEYCVLPTTGICAVPDDVDPAELAPFMCAGVVCYQSLKSLNINPGSLVAIHGIGGVGHLAVQFSRAMGFRTVAISSSPSKRELVLSLGAEKFIDTSKEDVAETLQRLGGADVIVTTPATTAPLLDLLRGLAYEGKLLTLGLAGDKVPFTPFPVVTRNRLSIVGYLCGTAEDCAETIRFAREHGVKCLVEKFPLERMNEAFDHREKARFRSVVIMS